MVADYYSDSFNREHNYGEEIILAPESYLFIPVRGNLRAIIKADRIKTPDYPTILSDCEERTPPSLFWEENLVPADKGSYVFETKYATDSDSILPVSYLSKIPDKFKEHFLRKVPAGIHELSNKLIGNEKDTGKILHKFHRFVIEHEKLESPTTGKPIEQLLNEYGKTGFFYGNCKEARDFYMALCNSLEYPTKGVSGKALTPYAHVWVDVFVPVEDGYKLIPVDATLRNFAHHNPRKHLFFEKSPKMPIKFISDVLNWFTGKSTKEYRLKIERMD